jgi:hypothetical protein
LSVNRQSDHVLPRWQDRGRDAELRQTVDAADARNHYDRDVTSPGSRSGFFFYLDSQPACIGPKQWHIQPMKMFDVQCQCGAQYRCAESASMPGEPGKFTCTTCGATVEQWDVPSKRAYRLIVAPDKAYLGPS